MTAAEFVLINSSYGYGCVSGNGSGCGYGYGYGDGSGSSGGGSYAGDGYGHGDGLGYGCGLGYGYGDGKLAGPIINAFKVYDIDDIDTIIYKVKGNIAKGAIINADMTLTPCYIAKEGNRFAHGETLHEANKALHDKLIEKMPIDKRIDLFLKQFDLNKKYPASDFFEWHHKLTGSCLIGRRTFCKNHNINIDSDSFTVGEFIELTQNDYNGKVIKALADRVKKEE